MTTNSIWCLFLMGIGLAIGGLYAFGWWTRHAASADAQASAVPPVKQVRAIEAQHWRSLVMQQ